MTAIYAGGALRYGLMLPGHAHSPVFGEDWWRRIGPAEMATVARAADAGTFDYLAVADHVALPVELADRIGSHWLDPVATLAWAAAQTSRVRLASLVYVLPYRRPLQAAKAFLSLDHLSGGRVIAGVGAGYVEGEFAALGACRAERGAATDAAIDLLHRAFRDEVLAVPRKDGGSETVALAPRPVGPIPVWVGGSSKAALRRAAERADGWMPQGTPSAELPAAISYLRERRREARGEEPIDIGAMRMVYLGTPRAGLGRTVQGSAEHLAERLCRLRAIGVDHVLLRPRSRSLGELLEQLEGFATEVAPLVAAGQDDAEPTVI